MRPTVALTALALVLGLAAANDALAAIRRAPTRAAAVFPRVVSEDFVRRLAAKAPPAIDVVPVPDYRPPCCFESTSESTCHLDADEDGMCWLDAGDGCGPTTMEGAVLAYWPEGARIMTASGSAWGEVSREEQRRAIREILGVLAERQPAKPVGLVAYAVGYVESGFNPTAEHPRTKACGLYQFLSGTWRDFAGRDVKEDPTACRNPRENASAAVTFLSELYDRNIATIVEQTPGWETLSEWDRLTSIFVGLYSLHNYGPNDPRWQLPENGARQIALMHVGILKDFYEGLEGELRRMAPRARPAKRRR